MFILALSLLILTIYNPFLNRTPSFVISLLLTAITAISEPEPNKYYPIYKESHFDLYNYSDSAMYIYMKYNRLDSLPLEDGLNLYLKLDKDTFDFDGNKMFMPITHPTYRINAFEERNFILGGDYRNPKLPPNFKELTIFFIKEATMQKYDWKQIHDNQMYEQRVVLTKEDLHNKEGRYVYISPKYKEPNSRFVHIPFYGYENEENYPK